MPFAIAFSILGLLAVLPFWRSGLLPLQDYPHFLELARAFADCHDPASPFFGTYTIDFPLSPLVLPLLLARGLGALVGFEQAGRILWTLYAVSLPLAALYLLRVLGRPREAVFFVFPLVLSYWVIGGFFGFATGAPLLLFGLASTVRWFESPTVGRGAALAAIACAVDLWHGYLFAAFVVDVGALWLLFRFPDGRARLRAIAPFVPAALLYLWWMHTMSGRPHALTALHRATVVENGARFFEFIAPILPHAAIAIALFTLLAIGSTAATPRNSEPRRRRRYRRCSFAPA
jgi:hypothetical protein